jgi:hypothetical protein
MDRVDKTMTIIHRNKPGIDRAVRGVVKELNDAGYKTFGSCAGHYKSHRGFITISPYKGEMKKLFAECPELINMYIRTDVKKYSIGFSQRPISVEYISQVFKKHGIYPIYHQPPKISINKGKLNIKESAQFVHSFTFPPQMVGEL